MMISFWILSNLYSRNIECSINNFDCQFPIWTHATYDIEAGCLLFVLLNTLRGDLTNMHQVSEILVVVESISHHKLI